MSAADLARMLSTEYRDAFSTRSPREVLRFYAPGARIVVHRRQGDTPMFNGSALGALLHLALPARFVFWLFYRRLAKRGYHHSNIEVLGVKPMGEQRALARVRFERVDGGGAVFEASQAVYLLERVDGAWRIGEVWMSEDGGDPPGVDLAGFEPARY